MAKLLDEDREAEFREHRRHVVRQYLKITFAILFGVFAVAQVVWFVSLKAPTLISKEQPTDYGPQNWRERVAIPQPANDELIAEWYGRVVGSALGIWVGALVCVVLLRAARTGPRVPQRSVGEFASLFGFGATITIVGMVVLVMGSAPREANYPELFSMRLKGAGAMSLSAVLLAFAFTKPLSRQEAVPSATRRKNLLTQLGFSSRPGVSVLSLDNEDDDGNDALVLCPLEKAGKVKQLQPFFAIHVNRTSESLEDEQQATEFVAQLWKRALNRGNFLAPTLLFLFSTEDDRGYFGWVMEPKVDELLGATLTRITSPRMTAISKEAIDAVFDEVARWFKAMAEILLQAKA